FIEALAARKIDVVLLGPARLHRLRTHGDAKIAARATQVIDDLKGPEAKEKDALIAKLRPEVEKPGDVANGRKVYTANCAGCHIYKGEGRNLAPNLNGMGAHGAADLLIHIVDPNRVVEPNFISISVETRSGDQFDGIIERENASELVLRDASSDHTLRVSDIASRKSTGRSLMPEGFDALGAAALRDLLAYMTVDDTRFRILDLGGAFTANSGRGLYITPEQEDDTVTFRSYGLKRVEDIPFDVISPEKAVANVVVLKGGAPDSWSRKNLPKRVEVKVGVAASKLHLLGGVAGWGYPAVGEKINALKITAVFEGGATQEIVLKNGVEVADYRGRPDVTGSKGLPSWTKGPGQIRWLSKNITKPGVIQKLVLESYDNEVAPTLFAITAELGAPAGPEQAQTEPVAAPLKWGD
ncbi:MAG: c-type cytochrome, partial [Verrucomicrobiota bacterium]